MTPAAPQLSRPAAQPRGSMRGICGPAGAVCSRKQQSRPSALQPLASMRPATHLAPSPAAATAVRTPLVQSAAALAGTTAEATAPSLPPRFAPASALGSEVRHAALGDAAASRRCRVVAMAAPAAACATTCAASAAAAAVATTAAASSSSPLMDLFAVVLGYGCLVGSFFRSVPQIAVILRTGSAEGLSLTSNLMELLCFTVTVAYNIQQGYAFNTYGEVFACWIQDVIIVGLIVRHIRMSGAVVAASTAVFAASCAWLFSSWCPMEVLSALQMSTIAVMAVGARLPQIWLNVKRGNAGVLSPLTCLLNVAGCVVRIFTTVVLTRDVIILGGCVTQLLLNAVLLYQSVVTPGNPTTTPAATVAATDPPVGGAGEKRGQTPGLGGDSDGGGSVPSVPVPAAA